MGLVSELRRRNVFRMAALYVVAAWLIMQVAEVIVALAELPGWSGQIVLALLAVGFPIALVFSWFYELTPEGLSLEKDVHVAESITRITGRRMDFIVISLLCAAIILFAYDKWWIGPPPEKSIAVLPFENIGADPAQEYLSDGIAEELLNLLTRVRELRVSPRSSSFAFRGQNLGVSDIAKRLNVAHVLTGSVRRSGSQVRVTAWLVDAHSGTQVWSESYDGQLEDIFVVQDDIAASVVSELRLKLLGAAPTAARTSPEAYSLYLQGNHMRAQDSKTGILGGIALLEKALAIDPDYSPAWASLVVAYSNAVGNHIPVDEGVEKLRAANDHLLRTDPNSPVAFIMLGTLARRAGDLEAASRFYAKALRLAPNNDWNLNNAALHLVWLGRWNESAQVFKVLAERNPTVGTFRANLGAVYIMMQRLDEAQAFTDMALALSPDSYIAAWNKVHLLVFHSRQYAAALENCERLGIDLESEPTKYYCRALIYPKLGRPEDGEVAMTALAQDYESSRATYIEFVPYSYAVARMYALNNQADAAFEWLEKTYETSGNVELTFAWNDAFLESLHDDSRWPLFLEKAGVTEEQMRAIEFEVTLTD